MQLSRYALRTKLLALALLPLAATFVFAALWLSNRVEARDEAREAAARAERLVLLSDLMYAISLDGSIGLADTAEGREVVGGAGGLLATLRRSLNDQIDEQRAQIAADEPYYRALLGEDGWRDLNRAVRALQPLRAAIAATATVRGVSARDLAHRRLVERYRRATQEIEAVLLRVTPPAGGGRGGLIAIPTLVVSQVLALRESQAIIRLMASERNPRTRAIPAQARELAGRRDQLLDTIELTAPEAFADEIAWTRGGPTERAWGRVRDRVLVAGGVGRLYPDQAADAKVVSRLGDGGGGDGLTDVVILAQARVAGFDGLRARLSERVLSDARADAAHAQQQLVLTVVALIVLSLTVLLVVVGLIRSTSSTVSSLLDRAGRIRAGELDVAPVAIRGHDELGRLGRAFDEMASTLRAVDHQARALADGRFEESDSERLPGRIGGAISQSVTRLRDATEAVLARERLARAIVDGAAEAIWTIDPDGVVQSANAVAADMSGLPVDRVVGGRAADVLPPELAALDARGGGIESLETRITPAGADARHILLTARLVEDEEGGALVTLFARDISERKEYEDLLAFEASHDPLTGLANRAGVLARIQSALGRTVAGGRRFAVLFVDLDRFKSVNDALGHRAGDALLMAAGRRLAEVARGTDLVGRIGGDEFVVVIDPLDPLLDVDARARHLLTHLTRPFEIEGHSALVSASVGITVEDGSASDAVEVLQHADMAMYAAKRDGSRAVGLYDEQIRERARERSDIEERLRDALANDGLRAYYQPIVDIADGRVAGAELLARWPTADGFVSPGEFIPVAEETGLVVDIGRWALREACTLLARGSERRELWVSVNISADHLAGSDLHAHVEEALAASGADPRRLVIEITETSLMGAGEAFARLERIRDLGVRVAIDDFGTGYSSLAYLRRLPVDVVKIDRAFVRDARTDRVAEAIIRMVNSIAADLGVETIAEGIETVEDRRALRALGARLAQGFLFTPALPADELARWKERWRREGGSPG